LQDPYGPLQDEVRPNPASPDRGPTLLERALLGAFSLKRLYPLKTPLGAPRESDGGKTILTPGDDRNREHESGTYEGHGNASGCEDQDAGNPHNAPTLQRA
jgi:hypothetical protein